MKYRSTRGGEYKKTFREIVMQGLAKDGGLFVPEIIPQVDHNMLKQWTDLSYAELAIEIMALYIDETEIPRSDLETIVSRTYNDVNFDSSEVTPLVKLKENFYLLELFHGPTMAFKDIALQFMGNLFEYFLEKGSIQTSIPSPHVTLLGATSGDTGGAAIYGIKDRKNMDLFIVYPKGRVSNVQEKQMTTVEAENIHVIAVEGTFDDCQNVVKDIFEDLSFRQEMNLTAINSINWARILSQIVYYFYAYFRIIHEKRNQRLDKWNSYEKMVFSVPTGNFGNVLAGYYAKRMGCPIHRLVVGTNENDILTRFFQRGEYIRRNVVPTLAPAMDIQTASNFERYLFYLGGERAEHVSQWMRQYRISNDLLMDEQLYGQTKEDFVATAVNESKVDEFPISNLLVR